MKRSRVDVGSLHAAYAEWTRTKSMSALPLSEFTAALPARA